MSDGKEAPAALHSLQLNSCHGAGHVSVGWFKSEGTWNAVTSGADGKLAIRQLRGNKELKIVQAEHGAFSCVAVNPDSTMVAALDGQYVKTWSVPDLQPSRSAVTRFVQPPRCCCWSKDGTLITAAGDESAVKVITAKENKVLRTVRADGYVRGLALDPEGTYIAAANADGNVLVWDMKTGEQELKKRLATKLDHDDVLLRHGLAWHPDGGSLLAVSGTDNDVILLERLSWKPVSYLAGAHTGHVRVVAFSPNGVYAATAGADGKILVWMVESTNQVSARQLSSPASSLAWHPQNNILLIGGSDGGCGVWVNAVPESEQNLPSPWKPLDDILKEADKAAGAAAAKGDADLEDDMDNDDSIVIKRKGPDDTMTAGQDADFGEILDQLDAAAEGATAVQAGVLRQTAPGGSRVLGIRAVKPQGPLHPGSTPVNSSGARFLAYNQMGCVVTKAVDDHHVVEVSFHDRAKHRHRVPHLTDFYGFFAAALGPRGVAYISASAGAEQPSMLVYRGFESWASGSDWSVALPEGEEAVVVAAGAQCVCVATSTRLLRLYSLAGRQLTVLSLPGTPIAAVAPDPGHVTNGGPVEATSQHVLAVVWAEGGPEPASNTQQLAYVVYDVCRCCCCHQGKLALSAGASLSWLGLTAEGLLAAVDSTQVLRVRSPEWGGAWMPLLDAAAAKAAVGAERVWPGWLDSNTMMAVVTTNKSPYPQASPRPLMTPIPLAMPTAPCDPNQPSAQLEEQVLRSSFALAHLKSVAADMAIDDPSTAASIAKEVEAAQVEADKINLRLFNAYLKASKQARALELVGGLNAVKSIEGALKLANHHHLPSLAERIQAFLEQRLQWEEEQQQQQQLASQEEFVLGGHAAAAQLGSDAMDVQQDERQSQEENLAGENTVAAAASTKAAQHSSAVAKPLAPLFGGTNGLAGRGSSAGGQKRKPAAPDMLPSGKGSGSGGNPFARKKVTK